MNHSFHTKPGSPFQKRGIVPQGLSQQGITCRVGVTFGVEAYTMAAPLALFPGSVNEIKPLAGWPRRKFNDAERRFIPLTQPPDSISLERDSRALVRGPGLMEPGRRYLH